ncbi:hypothetical protein VTN31DRAFT_5594 [Thermomyces dupontii]|uniref:uncharacterized protein n=1 Tax=Talaromyces thermophilus TaxID=28565 RepID=UPI0037444993
MSRTLPKFDPYAVLKVSKDAEAAEIRSSYLKLALKTHPDKVKDESLRAQAADEFQKIQEAYELLSNSDTRKWYDHEVQAAALKKEAREAGRQTGGSPGKAAPPREFQDGHFYEERTPAGVSSDDSDEYRYPDEPPAYLRKYPDAAKRSHTKVNGEKKPKQAASNAKVPAWRAARRAAKESSRDSVKAGHHDRAKTRTRERRRDASDKYERTKAPYIESDVELDGDDDYEEDYIRYKVEVKTAYPRDSRSRHSKSDSQSSKKSASSRYESDSSSESDGSNDDEFVYRYASNLDDRQTFVREYIRQKKTPIIEIDRRPKMSRGHTDVDPERYSSGATSHHHSRSHARDPSPRPARRSRERLDSPTCDYERSPHNTPTPTTSSSSSKEKVRSSTSSSRPMPSISRSATTPYRSSRSSKSESKGSLAAMVEALTGRATDPSPRSRTRGDRTDSGYSSPGTPEMTSGPKVSRYKVVDPPDVHVMEPEELNYGTSPGSSTATPLMSEGRRGSAPARSTAKPCRTYTYESGVRIETVRPAASRPLFGEVRYASDVRYGKFY